MKREHRAQSSKPFIFGDGTTDSLRHYFSFCHFLNQDYYSTNIQSLPCLEKQNKTKKSLFVGAWAHVNSKMCYLSLIHLAAIFWATALGQALSWELPSLWAQVSHLPWISRIWEILIQMWIEAFVDSDTHR